MKQMLILLWLIPSILLNSCKSDNAAGGQNDPLADSAQLDPGATLAVTINGKKLFELPEPDSIKAQKKKALDDARMFYLGNLKDVKSYLKYGYTNLEMAQVENAIQIFSKGLEQFQNTADLYLYRGIALVQGRQFKNAVNDFWKAGKAVEGQKDVKGILERSEEEKKIDASIHYHIYKWMGLAFQAQGDFSNAEKMYEVCGDFSTNSDLHCISYYWQYQAYSRSGRVNDAASILETVDEKMYISESTRPYLDALLYLKSQKSETDLVNLDQLPKSSEEARAWTIKAYALALRAQLENKEEKWLSILEKILASPFWNQEAYIAAEADHHAVKGFNYEEMKESQINSESGKQN